ncbi:hypothetical protein B0A49_00639 [Cryomyces minteri]|uniref:HNH nuclease domain-containing protein n=1 Tax=Cryomyces minteri TaxID=331657 RepID=A0A4U0XXY6_9PEZI|nr:hypothetical protein B0A49_00639 [Cryomyces minteri]
MRDRARLEFGVQAKSAVIGLGEAYLASLAELLSESAGATVETQGKRCGFDQDTFKARVGGQYAEVSDDPHRTPRLWCPITKIYHVARVITTAHIVPYRIKNMHAAYIFGRDPGSGYEVIWDKRNGFCLHITVQTLFDEGHFVIVPDGTSEDGVDEFKVVVLDEELYNEEYPIAPGVTFRGIHNHRLEWGSTARPAKRYLYFHFLLSIFRRRKYAVTDWGQDRIELSPTQVWATPGSWIRRSMLRPLAYEIGDWDCSELSESDLESELGTFDDGRSLPADEEARMATCIRNALTDLTASDW